MFFETTWTTFNILCVVWRDCDCDSKSCTLAWMRLSAPYCFFRLKTQMCVRYRKKAKRKKNSQMEERFLLHEKYNASAETIRNISTIVFDEWWLEWATESLANLDCGLVAPSSIPLLLSLEILLTGISKKVSKSIEFNSPPNTIWDDSADATVAPPAAQYYEHEKFANFLKMKSRKTNVCVIN